MIKFVHKKHINKENHPNKIVIYYSPLDIILGIVLISFVAFFVSDYLSHRFGSRDGDSSFYASKDGRVVFPKTKI